jgi:hypothetical protein
MSSETSIDSVRLKADTTDRHGGEPSVRLQPDRDALEPWQLFTLAGLIGATIVVFVSTGQTPAGIILLSLTIFTAAVVGVAAWRTLSPLTGRDEPVGTVVLGGRARAALEREKTLVLRSIKELEFDRAMGKVSEKDFAEMSARLRARAAGLIRQLDAGSAYRDQIEKDIARRVGQQSDRSGAGLPDRRSSQSEGGHGPRGGPQGSAPHAIKTCPQCNQKNDPDARFCKSCGSTLESA